MIYLKIQFVKEAYVLPDEEKEALQKAYVEASKDPDREEVIGDWAELDYEPLEAF